MSCQPSRYYGGTALHLGLIMQMWWLATRKVPSPLFASRRKTSTWQGVHYTWCILQPRKEQLAFLPLRNPDMHLPLLQEECESANQVQEPSNTLWRWTIQNAETCVHLVDQYRQVCLVLMHESLDNVSWKWREDGIWLNAVGLLSSVQSSDNCLVPAGIQIIWKWTNVNMYNLSAYMVTI